VIRGGSWNNEPTNLRSAYRNRNPPDKRIINLGRNNNLGFRLAQSTRTAHRAQPGAGPFKDGPGVVRGCP
jgi:hypothetical protein